MLGDSKIIRVVTVQEEEEEAGSETGGRCRHAKRPTSSTIRRQTAARTASIDNNSRTSRTTRTTASRHLIGLHTLIVGRDGYELQSLTL